MPFPPSAACRNLDLPPVNLRFLQLHLTKNSFAIAPIHLCGVALNVHRRLPVQEPDWRLSEYQGELNQLHFRHCRYADFLAEQARAEQSEARTRKHGRLLGWYEALCAEKKRKNAHEHCWFCWQCIGPCAVEGKIEEDGYVTLERSESAWLCNRCFQDFHEQFHFQISDVGHSSSRECLGEQSLSTKE